MDDNVVYMDDVADMDLSDAQKAKLFEWFTMSLKRANDDS
jgi:hypothetical protein